MKKTILAVLLSLAMSTAQSNVNFTTEVYPIFSSAGCLGGNCHGSGGSSGGLTMGGDATTVYSNIVDVASTCNNLDYIEPGDPNTSHLYLKCTASFSCVGSRMPRNGTSYFTTNEDQLETIRVWIEEGALAEPAQVTVQTENKMYPEKFTLFPNYPNPFNPITTIRFDIPVETRLIASLQIFDITGRVVETLVDGNVEPGMYTIKWDASALPSGVYFVHLISGSMVQSKKMILLK